MTAALAMPLHGTGQHQLGNAGRGPSGLPRVSGMVGACHVPARDDRAFVEVTRRHIVAVALISFTPRSCAW